MLINARSIKNKTDELQILLSEQKPDVVVITETWLDSSYPSDLMKFDDYSIPYRCDRQHTIGGGALIMLKESLGETNPFDIDFPSSVEAIAVHCKTLHFIVLGIYIPPSLPCNELELVAQSFNNLADTIDRSDPQTNILVTGDFNIVFLRKYKSMLESLFGSKACVTDGTRGERVLDNIFCPLEWFNLYKPASQLPPLGNSDHNICLLEPVEPLQEPVTSHIVYDYRKSYLSKYIQRIEKIDWRSVFLEKDIHLKTKIFNRHMEFASKAIPSRKIFTKHNLPPWITGVHLDIKTKKDAAFQAGNKVRFQTLNVKLNKYIENAKQEAIRNAENSRDFWEILNAITKRKTRSGLSSLLAQYNSS